MNKVGPQNDFRSWKILVPKMSGLKNFGSQNIFGLKIFLVPENVESQICMSWDILGLDTSSPLFFWDILA